MGFQCSLIVLDWANCSSFLLAPFLVMTLQQKRREGQRRRMLLHAKDSQAQTFHNKTLDINIREFLAQAVLPCKCKIHRMSGKYFPKSSRTSGSEMGMLFFVMFCFWLTERGVEMAATLWRESESKTSEGKTNWNFAEETCLKKVSLDIVQRPSAVSCTVL